MDPKIGGFLWVIPVLYVPFQAKLLVQSAKSKDTLNEVARASI
jgi:hypothetical protein